MKNILLVGILLLVGLYPKEPLSFESTTITRYSIHVDLMVYPSEIEAYPVVWEQFKNALKEWSSLVPVRWGITEFSPASRWYHRAIEIHLTDLQNSHNQLSSGFLGIWMPDKLWLGLDADSLESVPKAAYSVALHEIGHLLGVPHIINWSDRSTTGYIVLEEGTEASGYVMYPEPVAGYDQKKLSILEVSIATQFLLQHMTNPGWGRKITSCSFSLTESDE